MKIELNSYDLYIKEVETNDGTSKVVSIRNALAFNSDFIEEMKSNGVKEYVSEEETETTEE